MCSRAFGAFHNRRAVGVLRFGRARMSEDTAQGSESELQDARGRRISKPSSNPSNPHVIDESNSPTRSASAFICVHLRLIFCNESQALI